MLQVNYNSDLPPGLFASKHTIENFTQWQIEKQSQSGTFSLQNFEVYEEGELMHLYSIFPDESTLKMSSTLRYKVLNLNSSEVTDENVIDSIIQIL